MDKKMNNSQPLSIITYFNYTCIHTHTHMKCMPVQVCTYVHVHRRQKTAQDSVPFSLIASALLYALTWPTLKCWASSSVLLPTLLLQMQADVSSFLYVFQGPNARHSHAWLALLLWKTQCTFYWIFQNKFLGEQDHKPSLYIAYSKMEDLVITDKVIINQIFS